MDCDIVVSEDVKLELFNGEPVGTEVASLNSEKILISTPTRTLEMLFKVLAHKCTVNFTATLKYKS